jgi:hypothetical protein
VESHSADAEVEKLASLQVGKFKISDFGSRVLINKRCHSEQSEESLC